MSNGLDKTAVSGLPSSSPVFNSHFFLPQPWLHGVDNQSLNELFAILNKKSCSFENTVRQIPEGNVHHGAQTRSVPTDAHTSPGPLTA